MKFKRGIVSTQTLLALFSLLILGFAYTVNLDNYSDTVKGIKNEASVVLAQLDYNDGYGYFYDEIPGCTDPDALNYNPVATEDDGGCQYEEEEEAIYGCLDTRACNYNPLAVIDDKEICNFLGIKYEYFKSPIQDLESSPPTDSEPMAYPVPTVPLPEPTATDIEIKPNPLDFKGVVRSLKSLITPKEENDPEEKEEDKTENKIKDKVEERAEDSAGSSNTSRSNNVSEVESISEVDDVTKTDLVNVPETDPIQQKSLTVSDIPKEENELETKVENKVKDTLRQAPLNEARGSREQGKQVEERAEEKVAEKIEDFIKYNDILESDFINVLEIDLNQQKSLVVSNIPEIKLKFEELAAAGNTYINDSKFESFIKKIINFDFWKGIFGSNKCQGIFKETFAEDFVKNKNLHYEISNIKRFIAEVTPLEMDTFPIYDENLQAGVKIFQDTFGEYILEPQGLSEPNGYWDELTAKVANDIVSGCGKIVKRSGYELGKAPARKAYLAQVTSADNVATSRADAEEKARIDALMTLDGATSVISYNQYGNAKRLKFFGFTILNICKDPKDDWTEEDWKKYNEKINKEAIKEEKRLQDIEDQMEGILEGENKPQPHSDRKEIILPSGGG